MHGIKAAARRRGFNLIEAAIVLGVIGLVIGGIWVAAAKVQQNMRVNDAEKLILVSKDFASGYTRTIGGATLVIAQIMQPSAGFSVAASGNTYTNGQQTYEVYLNESISVGGQTAPYLSVYLDFAPGDVTVPDFCITLSRRLLGQPMGQAPASTLGSVVWRDAASDPTAAWFGGSAVPSLYSVNAACIDAVRMEIYWQL